MNTFIFIKIPQIIATLDGSLGISARKKCLDAGAKVDRIHTAKMNIDTILKAIRTDIAAGLDIMIDLPGIKGRTQRTSGMIQPNIPGEKNNWLLPIPHNWRKKKFKFWLIPLSVTEEQITDKDKYVRATIIPKKVHNEDIIIFGDDNIQTKVIATSKQGIREKVLQLQIVKVNDNSPGIWWKMGYSSTTQDLFTGHQSILSKYDLSILKAISKSNKQADIDEIAVSFVAKTKHIDEIINTLDEFKFDYKNTEIVLKIETLEAIENLHTLSQYTSKLIKKGYRIIFELGRGDLGIDCKSKGKNIREVQTSFLEIAHQWDIPIIIATDVASSTINANRNGEVIKLSDSEIHQISGETLCRHAGTSIVGYMLAAETKNVPYPWKTIDAVQKTLNSPNNLIQPREYMSSH